MVLIIPGKDLDILKDSSTFLQDVGCKGANTNSIFKIVNTGLTNDVQQWWKNFHQFHISKAKCILKKTQWKHWESRWVILILEKLTTPRNRKIWDDFKNDCSFSKKACHWLHGEHLCHLCPHCFLCKKKKKKMLDTSKSLSLARNVRALFRCMLHQGLT